MLASIVAAHIRGCRLSNRVIAITNNCVIQL